MSETKQMTKAEVMQRVKGLDTERRNATVCALVGHSKIQTIYYNCGRCGAQVVDSLASVYPGAEKAVVIGHNNCDVCRKNAETLTWRDTLHAPDLFKVEEQPA